MWETERTMASLMAENEALRQHVLKLEESLIMQQQKEDYLKQELAFLQQIMDQVPLLLWQSDFHGKVVFCNKNWLDLVGLEKDNVLSGKWKEVIHPEDWTNFKRIYQDAARFQIPFTREYRLRDPQGQYRWMLDRAQPVLNSEGKFQGYIGASCDITEHKDKDQKLQVNEKKYRELFQQSSSGIILHQTTNNSSFEFIEMNDQVYKMLGYTREELMKTDFSNICCDSSKVKEIVCELMSDGYSSEEILLETYLSAKSGRHIPVEIRFKNFAVYDQQYILWIIRDISQRKKIEEWFRQSELRYRKLFKFCPEALFVVDEEKILLVNKAAAELLGAKKTDELIGKASWEFVHPDYYAFCMNSINLMKKERRNVPPMEEKFIRLDGSLVDVEVTGTYIYYEEKMSYLFIARDITDRKKLDKLKYEVDESNRRLIEAVEYDKLKSEFFANISHELKTPLNVILGAVQLQEFYLDKDKELLLENTPRNIKMIKQNSYRLIRLVNNLIDITKIDCGYMQMKLKKEDMVTIVRNITNSVQDYAGLKGIDIECHISIPEKRMSCDADHIERILLNLISNAIKFTDKGGKIDVSLSEDQVEGCIVLAVRDTGIGISQDKQEIIFERFRQVDKSLSRNQEGSGIGLSIVKALVEMHGGSVGVKSEYGKGSIFTVKLPIRHEEESQDESLEESGWSNQIERINIEFSDIYF